MPLDHGGHLHNMPVGQAFPLTGRSHANQSKQRHALARHLWHLTFIHVFQYRLYMWWHWCSFIFCVGQMLPQTKKQSCVQLGTETQFKCKTQRPASKMRAKGKPVALVFEEGWYNQQPHMLDSLLSTRIHLQFPGTQRKQQKPQTRNHICFILN
jgi:hypothetical protein